MDLVQHLGISPTGALPRLTRQVHLQLIANGLTPVTGAFEVLAESQGLLDQFLERGRLLADQRCPADQRIEAFLASYFRDTTIPWPLRLPDQTLVLHRHGLAKELSLPERGDEFASELLTSFRVRNGVLHNPKSDRRTTEGTFHVAEGGLPVPGDKKSVPKEVFAAMFHHAMNPPADAMVLPFTAACGLAGPEVSQTAGPAKPQAASAPARSFVSLLLRPIVCPEVPGSAPRRRRWRSASSRPAVWSAISISSNRSSATPAIRSCPRTMPGWTSSIGPATPAASSSRRISRISRRKQLGLPHVEQATERQRRDGMCWKERDEKYNDGDAFKLTCRTDAGVIVTLIADNYYGYCKKEVKTQISYAANLLRQRRGRTRRRRDRVRQLQLRRRVSVPTAAARNGRTFADVVRDYGALMDVQARGLRDRPQFPDLIYIPEDAARQRHAGRQVWWTATAARNRRFRCCPARST